MNDCLFCKISKGEIPSHRVWDEGDFFAILDKFPNREGVTLVISKEHQSSDFTEIEDEFLKRFIVAAKVVATKIKKGLGVPRVVLVIEGMGVPHAHIKLYPVYDEKEGSITTETGPEASDDNLRVIADKIRG